MEMEFNSAIYHILNSTYFYAILLGALLGVAELMGRYRDDPVDVLSSRYAFAYVAVNAGLAAISLFLINGLGLSVTPESTATGEEFIRQFTDAAAQIKSAAGSGADVAARIDELLKQAEKALAPNTEQTAAIYNVMLAGFGGAAFFRSSIMRASIGTTEVAVGPAIVIETLLKVTDRGVDRLRAQTRASEIADIMAEISLEETTSVLAPFCLALMQNLSASEQLELNEDAKKIAADAIKDDPLNEAKSWEIGLRLAKHVGFPVLRSAIESLRDGGILPPSTRSGTGSGFASIFGIGRGSGSGTGEGAKTADAAAHRRTPDKAEIDDRVRRAMQEVRAQAKSASTTTAAADPAAAGNQGEAKKDDD